jgi:EipB-like
MGKLLANLCLLAATFLVASTSPGYEAGTAVPLAAHRALYLMILGNVENSGTTSASGAMEYEVIDGCVGWAVQQRMDVTTPDRDGAETRAVSDYSTWESKDGHEFRFHIAQTDGDKIVRQLHVKGCA